MDCLRDNCVCYWRWFGDYMCLNFLSRREGMDFFFLGFFFRFVDDLVMVKSKDLVLVL